jgi:putative Mn2+ efflux pump MntP
MFAIALLAVSLSVDALCVGISFGIRKIKLPLLSGAAIFFMSLSLSALAVFTGRGLLFIIPGGIVNKDSGIVVILLGVYTAVKGFKKKSDTFDFDGSKKIELKEALYLGAAISVDTIAAGLVSASLFTDIYLIPIFTAVAHYSFLNLGVFAGRLLKPLAARNGVLVFISGAMLVVIGVMRLR